MGGEQQWLTDFINALHPELVALGLSDIEYGLIGFGRAEGGGDPRLILRCGGKAAMLAAIQQLLANGGVEDGYEAIDFAIDEYLSGGWCCVGDQRRLALLITDEDRDHAGGPDFATLLNKMLLNDITLCSICNATWTAAGIPDVPVVDENNVGYWKGVGGSIEQSGGASVTSSFGTTVADYVDLAFATVEGTTADINVLRQGGTVTEDFTEVLVYVLGGVITGAPGSNPSCAIWNLEISSSCILPECSSPMRASIYECDCDAGHESFKWNAYWGATCLQNCSCCVTGGGGSPFWEGERGGLTGETVKKMHYSQMVPFDKPPPPPKQYSEIRLRGIEIYEKEDKYHIESISNLETELYFEFDKKFIEAREQDGSVFFPPLLILAMVNDCPLIIDEPLRISENLLLNNQKLQKTMNLGEGTGCFFSLGVDSFYTLKEHLDKITHLISVYGFDIHPYTQKQWQDFYFETGTLEEKWQRFEERVRNVAESLDKELITVRTNFREIITNNMADWGHWAHGAALASVGLLFDGLLSECYISSTYNVRNLNMPWGSHPDLDLRWSSETLKFSHYGVEKDRGDKIKILARSEDFNPLVTKYLRVCWAQNDPDNCGLCQKCSETKAAFEDLGIELETFPNKPLL
jgi:hypothetical protein